MDLENKITSKEIVETGLGSIGKVKIIKALAEQEKMVTTYTLQKKTHLKREDIKRNLNDLIKIGWVKEIRLANLMYSVSLFIRLCCLKKFFWLFNYPDVLLEDCHQT
jgi:predicted HTH transcriptional regulator